MTDSYIQLPSDGIGKKSRTNLITVGADDVHQAIVQLADNSGNLIKIFRTRENISGAAGSGGDGDTNRVYTLTTFSDVDIVEVFVDGVLQIETTHYTIDNTAKTVTMLINVFDVQIITIFYNK
jgi:hypothetical protein